MKVIFFFQVQIFFSGNAAIVILVPVFQSASVGMKITKEHLLTRSDGFRSPREGRHLGIYNENTDKYKDLPL